MSLTRAAGRPDDDAVASGGGRRGNVDEGPILVACILLASCAMPLSAAEVEAPVKATKKEAFIAVATSVRKEMQAEGRYA